MSFTESERALLRASDATEKPGIRWGMAGGGLGSLSYDEVVRLHKPGVRLSYVAKVCGVNESSVSRWRAANDYVSVWMPRAWANEILAAKGNQ